MIRPCLFALCYLLFAANAAMAAAPYGLAARPAFAAFNGGKLPAYAAEASGDWSTEVAFPNLTFLNPVGVLPLPGTSKLVVWEREGRIYSFDDAPGAATKTLILDLHDTTQGWDDSGLLGLAFHPQFATNGYVYVWYNRVPPGTVRGDANTRPPWGEQLQRLSRFTYEPATGLLDPASEYIVIDQIDHSAWHNGGGLFFHPADGFLYLTNGNDANPTLDQSISGSFFACLLRIDVDKRGGAISHPPVKRAYLETGPNWPEAYYVPNDNPFVGVPDALEEIHALGLRSPHRATVDPVTGRVFIGDVGEAHFEEVNVIEPGEGGLNFQWGFLEGNQGELTPPHLGVSRRPLLDYTHSEGGAVIGGYVYRGTKYPELAGNYVFGDNLTNRIWMLDESTTPAGKVLLAVMPKGAGPNSGNDYLGLSSFGYDTQGELLLCQMSSVGGRIYRLGRTGPPSRQMPLTLSETGVFSNPVTLATAPGFLAYEVISPLWSDGARKRRWFAIPSGTKIGYRPLGDWTFPQGSVFVKHFELPIDERDPARVQRLETRVLVRDDQGHVYGGSYQWRADNSEADLVIEAVTQDVTITTTDGGTRVQPWFYPGRQDCLACHNRGTSGVLGLNTQQSHRAHFFPQTGQTDGQLRAWNRVGYFAPAISESALPSLKKLTAPGNSSAPVEKRARSYLDANCAHCHRPGGVRSFWDARIETPLAEARIVNGAVQTNFGTIGARVIVPGNLSRSLLHTRLGSARQNYAMPPLAKNVVDQDAMSLIEQWIASVSAPPPVPLPAPWLSTDIGDISVPGQASFGAGVFSMEASGGDIWSQDDAFHFIHRTLQGDGQFTARIAGLSPTDPWTKAGVMIRETLAASARNVMMAVTPKHGIVFQRRNIASKETFNVEAAGAAPAWLRIERRGDEFIGSRSSDGLIWKEVSRTTIAMGAAVEIGLCLTSHNSNALAAASFESVSFQFPLELTMADPPPAMVTGPFSWQVTGNDPRMTFEITGLPGGLTFNAGTGFVSGTPTVSGAFPVQISASTPEGGSVTQSFTLNVEAFPALLAGGYAGLVQASAEVNTGLGGRFTVQLTRNGTLTGKLYHGASAAPLPLLGRITGLVGGQPQVLLQLAQQNTPLTLTLNFQPTDATITGSLSTSAGVAQLEGRHVVATSAASAYAATYNTELLPASADSGDPSKPQGAGWCRVTVTGSGAVSIVGRLADGEPISIGSSLCQSLSVPVHGVLYSGHGFLAGWPALREMSGPALPRELAGTLDWRKLAPASSTDRGYPSFTATPEALGRAYRPPAAGTLFLGLAATPGGANARIDFTEAGLASAAQGSSASQSFELTTAHTSIFATDSRNPCGTAFAIDPRTGRFNGSFRLVDGAVTRTAPFSGLFIPGQTRAHGWFRLPQLPLTPASPILSGLVEVREN